MNGGPWARGATWFIVFWTVRSWLSLIKQHRHFAEIWYTTVGINTLLFLYFLLLDMAQLVTVLQLTGLNVGLLSPQT